MGASRQQHNKAPPHCLVYYSTAQHSTAKHSKAQHSTTQQNTARRSAKPVVCLHGSWARLQQARLQEAPSPWCKLLAVAVAVAVIAVVPWLRLRLRLWGSSHGAKHLPSKQPGLWEGGAGCESRDGFGGRAGAKTVAASVAEGSSGAGDGAGGAGAGAGAGAAANRCTLQSGAGRRRRRRWWWWVQVWSSRQRARRCVALRLLCPPWWSICYK